MDEEKNEKIERYLKDRMSAEERDSFEKEKAEDEELEGEVTFIKDLISATGDKELIELEQLVADSINQLESKEADQKKGNEQGQEKPFNRVWKILLGLFLLVGVLMLAYYFYGTGEEDTEGSLIEETLQNSPLNPQERIDQDLPVGEEPDTNSINKGVSPTLDLEKSESDREVPYAGNDTPSTSQPEEEDQVDYRLLAMAEINDLDFSALRNRNKGSEGEEISVIDSAWRLFEEKAYPRVFIYLSEADSIDIDDTEFTYLRGLTHLKLEEFSPAGAEFEKITESFSRGYDSDWYLLLSLLAQMPKSKARFDLQMGKILNNESHPKLINAQTLNTLINRYMDDPLQRYMDRY